MIENAHNSIRQLVDQARERGVPKVHIKESYWYKIRTGYEDPPGDWHLQEPDLEIRRFILVLPTGLLEDLDRLLRTTGVVSSNFELRSCEITFAQEIEIRKLLLRRQALITEVTGKNGYGKYLEAEAMLFSPEDYSGINISDIGPRSFHWIKEKGLFQKQKMIAKSYGQNKADEFFLGLNNLLPTLHR